MGIDNNSNNNTDEGHAGAEVCFGNNLGRMFFSIKAWLTFTLVSLGPNTPGKKNKPTSNIVTVLYNNICDDFEISKSRILICTIK